MNFFAAIPQNEVFESLEDELTERSSRSIQAVELSDVLVAMNCLSDEDLGKVKNAQKRFGLSFGKAACKIGVIKRDVLEYALGVKQGFLRPASAPARIPQRFVVARNPFSRSAESFHQLRARILNNISKSDDRTICITPADPVTDAGYVTANLGVSIAQLGRKVLLVDADLRRSPLARIFGDAKAPGIANAILSGNDLRSAISDTLFTNIDLAPAGKRIADPSGALASLAFSNFIGACGRKYDVVLINAPAFGLGADCEFVWNVSDRTIIAVRRGQSRINALHELRRAARLAGIEITGAVLTG